MIAHCLECSRADAIPSGADAIPSAPKLRLCRFRGGGILQLEALEGGMNSDLYHDLDPLVCISHNAEAP